MKIGHVDWLLNRIEELEEERDEWKDTAYFYYMTNQILREQNKRYKQALEFYADEENHIAPYLYTQKDNVPVHDESEVDRDGGKKARQALKGE